MADKKKEESKPAAAPAARSLNEELYDGYVHGRVINEMADERGLDSREVLAIIQEVHESKRNK